MSRSVAIVQVGRAIVRVGVAHDAAVWQDMHVLVVVIARCLALVHMAVMVKVVVRGIVAVIFAMRMVVAMHGTVGKAMLVRMVAVVVMAVFCRMRVPMDDAVSVHVLMRAV